MCRPGGQVPTSPLTPASPVAGLTGLAGDNYASSIRTFTYLIPMYINTRLPSPSDCAQSGTPAY